MVLRPSQVAGDVSVKSHIFMFMNSKFIGSNKTFSYIFNEFMQKY